MFRDRSVSLVIPAFNEEQTIGRVVAEFREEPHLDEIVVVDNNCTDRTAELAAAQGARVVHEARPGYGSALMAGMKAASSDLLVPTLYGRSVKPPQPDGLWKSVTMIGERFRADSGDAIHRRSLYTYWKRGMPPPQMTLLNAPNRDACIARRERTNTSSQALLLLNETEYLKAARALAQKTMTQKLDSDEARLAFAYETVTAQLPDDRERAILLPLVKNLRTRYIAEPALAAKLCEGLDLPADAQAQLAAWTVLVNTLYNLDITKTRE